jgi:putative oxidoreductase
MLVINGFIALIGRIFLAAIFLISGIGKTGDISGTAAYLASAGLPTSLAWPSAIFEIVAALAIVFGFLTRLFAFLLAAFCLLTALLFHTDFGDPMQAANFWKNVALAGGFLVLFAYNGVSHSFDSYRERRRRPVVVEREPVVVEKRTL